MQNQGRFSLESMLRNAFGLNQAGRLDEAARAAKGILKLQPKEPNALYLLGIIAHQQGDTKAAGQWFEKCYKADKTNVGALSGLGILRMDQGRHAEALKFFERVLQQMPNDAATLNNLGLAKERLGEKADAVAYFERAVGAEPRYATARLNLGKALADVGKAVQARQHYEEGLRLAPNMSELHGNYANLLRFMNEHEQAVTAFENSLRLDPDDLDVNVNYANTLVELGRTERAIEVLEAAHRRYPENPAPILDLAEIVEADRENGKERAKALYQQAADIVAGHAKEQVERPQVAHRLGRAYDKLGRHDDAFRCWTAAHDAWKRDLQAGGVGYDPAAHDDNIARITDFFREFPTPPEHALSGETTPVFVVGMMRSGTSLMEQILASHSDVEGGGELLFLPEIVEGLETGRGHWTDALRAAGPADLEMLARRYLDQARGLFPQARHIVDKLPANFLNIGLIRYLFPSATIIHTRRNAIDTCLSIYMQNFATNIIFCHDLLEIAHYYRGYRRMMRFWHDWDPRLLAVDYEQMVADQQGTTAQVLEAIGLGWEDGVEKFYESDRAVKTASRLQVRQPVYKSAVARWRRYEHHLEPLIQALGDDAGDWPSSTKTESRHADRDNV